MQKVFFQREYQLNAFKIYHFILQGCIQFIKSNSKDLIQENYFRINAVFNNIKKILEQQINIFEWFLKDHGTLKTGIMMLKIQLCITGINY